MAEDPTSEPLGLQLPGPRPSLGRRLRRGLRRLSSRLRKGPVTFVYDRAYQLDLPAVPVDPLRGERVLSYLAGEGLLARGSVVHPRPASMRGLRRVHTDDYLESLRDPEALTRVLGARFDEITQERVLDLQRIMAGGTVLAARRARATGRVAVNLGGGFHHAFADHGERFCVLNDIAVAIRHLRFHGFARPILVVDLDLHDGDGTRSLFADDETVHTFSIHNQTNRPETAREATVLELGEGVEGEAYLELLRRELEPVVEHFRPRLVFYLAGVDPACDDEIGNWDLDAATLLERDRYVTRVVRGGKSSRQRGRPLVVVLGGGYGPQAWRYTARYCAWLITGGEVPRPPSTEEVTLARYRHLAKILTPRQLTGDPTDTWEITEEDILSSLAGPPGATRFLGYYSKHGIELALEKSGVLDRLRALGFRPRLEVDLSNPAGETLRLYGDDEGGELLMELRARRDALILRGLELLRVEWLLLQNPRAEFTGDRPRLPGQDHPGLGMLRDAIAFLILACDRLGLDGVVFAPSHYHLAAQSHQLLRFARPADEARFRAFRQALGDLPLDEATLAAEAARVVDRASGEPVAWEPAPMVLPVSERLAERLRGEEYEARVVAALEELDFTLEG